MRKLFIPPGVLEMKGKRSRKVWMLSTFVSPAEPIYLTPVARGKGINGGPAYHIALILISLMDMNRTFRLPIMLPCPSMSSVSPLSA